MKKYILIILCILLSANMLQAQVKREVEVTRDYIPIVEKAQKPHIKASIADTTQISPDVDYSITPLSINTSLKSRAINPAKVTYWEYNRPHTAQLKVGAGYPLNSLLQGVISTQNASVGYLAARVDHCGFYSDIETFDGFSKQNATQILNDASVAGGLYFKNKILAVDAHYLNNSYRNYAFNQHADNRIGYQGYGAEVSFGDDFKNLETFNYATSVSADSYFDRAMNSTNSLNADVDFGHIVSPGKLLYGANYSHIDEGEAYGVDNFGLYAELATKLLRLDVIVGLDYNRYYTSTYGEDNVRNYMIPRVLIKKARSVALIGYFKFGGSLIDNSFKSLSMECPFVMGGSSHVNPTSELYGMVGIEGLVAKGRLSYDLNIKMSQRDNNRYWAMNIFELSAQHIHNSYITASYGDLDIFSVNAELAFRPWSNLKFAFDAHYNAFHVDKSSAYVNSLPRFEGALSAEYSARRLTVGAKVRYLGERSFAVNRYSPTAATSNSLPIAQLPNVVDLSLFADYKLLDRVSIFAQGSNLCNENIYEWALYRGFGASFTAGVKVNFR